jgi:prepilin-type processing-associated H-X9-DG protein
MIRFVCECGKQLQAREENAGKLVLCPACQRQLTVPAAPLSPTPVQPEEPPVRPSAEPRIQRDRPALSDEPEIEEEHEREDRPRRRRQSAGSSGKATASLVLGILSMCGCTCLAGLPSIVLGILSLRDIGRAAGTLTGKPMAILGIVLGSLGTLCWPVVGIPAWWFSREAAQRAQSQINLRQIGLAMHNYNDTYQILPAAAIDDHPAQLMEQRKSNLSWRVAILPFIEGERLSRQFKLDEPWDGRNNRRLLSQMPKIYKMPGDDKTPPDHTHYQVFVGNGAAFDKTCGNSIPRDFPDGTSNTILVVEAAQAVPWTKPDDISFDPSKPIAPLLSTRYRGRCNILLADGSVRVVAPASTPESTLKAAITRNGNELVIWP